MSDYRFTVLAAAFAAASPATAQTLLLEYEGSVSQVEGQRFCKNWNYQVGDPISGLLKIDTSIAPPDVYDYSPDDGGYFAPGGKRSPDFVTGDRPLYGRHWDNVFVYNRLALNGGDRFTVEDRADATSATSYARILHLDVQWPEAGPIADKSLQQQFEAIPEKDGSVLYGYLQRVRGGLNYFTTTISFKLTRMSLKPAVCSK